MTRSAVLETRPSVESGGKRYDRFTDYYDRSRQRSNRIRLHIGAGSEYRDGWFVAFGADAGDAVHRIDGSVATEC
ncbi:hypothetical protein EA473_17630 [Natrarchaeobius chitinivorans]|uniref:Uncharacterized protein n=1 Tax=Natrarchaeobius chitinivorans TaxID=1679083 RepID=A0A3N6P353_NATCH|nr:hypothetical protein EA473_17630 [Natrarchaeobius chitinivorans]